MGARVTEHEREPVYRDPGDRERLRDLVPQWFRDLVDERDRDNEIGRFGLFNDPDEGGRRGD
jgi:hypothetical protein